MSQQTGRCDDRYIGGCETTAAEIGKLCYALKELAGIRSTAETAATAILTACERILEACESETPEKAKEIAEEAVIEIMTSCSFDDQVGQASTRAQTALKEARGALLKALPTAETHEPREDDERLDQSLVDSLLAKGSDGA
ncbi:hypothetical protein V6C03_06980 [Methyloligella sp. 2.7D]|uniref:hypothetical protein n=1 Tax=unclassified Methyloligella TaxID=2625955 RepID=UPI00157DB418|nr:hypothetical protein [Methyloligella sp. GL2]QKP78361.1 hypothetical protein HT051_13465 [Methyloligella sp. GL2]